MITRVAVPKWKGSTTHTSAIADKLAQSVGKTANIQFSHVRISLFSSDLDVADTQVPYKKLTTHLITVS